jgi:glycosyltransferase involved in cell wall biosynthesis
VFEEYDVVNLHSIYSFSSLSSIISRKNRTVPVVLTHHGKLKYGEPWKDACVTLYERSIAKKILQCVDHGISLSGPDTNFLLNLGLKRDKISEIPNAINTEEFSPYVNVNPSSFVDRYNLTDKFVILYVGELTFRKGIHFLIRALPEIIRTKPNQKVILIIVGTGPESDILRNLVKNLNLEDYVIFTGRLPFQELILAYKAASVFVLPSLSEGMPTVILEAMFFGVPVIATDIPCMRDRFEKHAILVPPENSKKLAEQIIQLMHHQEDCQELSRAGKELVLNHYTWDKIIGQYENIYKKLL